MSLDQRPQPLRYAGQPSAGGGGTTNLADLLERILDKGIVIAGDISISLVDVELLTIKLRLFIASVDKAEEMGVDWWRADPWLSSRAAEQRGNGSGEGDGHRNGNRLESATGSDSTDHRGRSRPGGRGRLEKADGQGVDQQAVMDRLERLESALSRLQTQTSGAGAGDTDDRSGGGGNGRRDRSQP